jgi:hypothetical protein
MAQTESINNHTHPEKAGAFEGVVGLSIKYGIASGVLAIAYFLIMHSLNLIYITELRFVNYFFLAICIFLALRNETKIEHHRLEYFPGVEIGGIITLITAFMFSIFMLIFSIQDSDFIGKISHNVPFSEYLNPGLIAFDTAAEVIIFGVILTFIFMQLFKKNRGHAGEEKYE